MRRLFTIVLPATVALAGMAAVCGTWSDVPTGWRELSQAECNQYSGDDTLTDAICSITAACSSLKHGYPACWFCLDSNFDVKRCARQVGPTCNQTGTTACGTKRKCLVMYIHDGECTWTPNGCNWGACSNDGACPDQDCS